MKYFSLNHRKRETLQIKPPNKGMDLTKPTAHIEEGRSSFCKNMIFEDGVFRTRKGIESDLKNILKIEEVDRYYTCEYRISNNDIFYDGENKRVAYALIQYNISHFYTLIYLLGENADVRYIGYFQRSRVTDDNFYVPVDLTFYTGTPQSGGGGIFAFVSFENLENPDQKIYNVYEMNSDCTYWERLYRFYIPTVYINGRGDSYELARAENMVSTLKPTSLEALNMLYNGFYAYYSSDGYSSSFRLPFTDIAKEGVVCRIYSSPSEYTEWHMHDTMENSTQYFGDTQVTFNIDHNTGIFYFTSNGSNYVIPQFSTYRENNIRILAHNKSDGSFENAVSCKSSARIKNTVLFSDGNEKNKVYYADYNNPLYLPKMDDNNIGFGDEKVNGLLSCQDAVYAYKDNKIYSIELANGDEINSTTLLADNGKTFRKKYSFKVKCISDKIGSVNKNTVSSFDGKPILQGKDKEVYFIGTSGRAIKLTEELNPILYEFDGKSCATVSGGRYMLFYENKVLVFDFNDTNNGADLEKVARYYWEFPSSVKVKGCADIAGTLVLLCTNENNTVCYTATLSGSKDTVILDSEQQATAKIPSFVKFKSYYLSESSCKKNIHSVLLQLSLTGKTKIKIGDGKETEEFTLKKNGFSLNYQDTVKIIPELNGVDLISITLDSESNMTFKGAEIYYTRMGI